MTVRLSKESKALGLAIYAAQFNTDPAVNDKFAYATRTDAAALDKAGFILWNMTLTQGDKIAAVLSQPGIEHFKPIAEKAAKAANKPEGEGGTVQRVAIDPSTLAIRKGIPVPVAPTRARRESKWPWDNYEVGDAQFVPKTAEVPDPVKSLKGTVSAANRKFVKINDAAIAADPTKAGSIPRTFQIVAGTDTDPTTNTTVEGAWIHRVK
jgi:hypothetical protein